MSLLHPFVHKFASYMWYIYICPKRTYSCIKRMRGQQVYLRERIPNAMFVTLSTYFYVGARMLYCSRKDVVYTNTDDTDKLKPQFTRYRACFACPSRVTHREGVSGYGVPYPSFENRNFGLRSVGVCFAYPSTLLKVSNLFDKPFLKVYVCLWAYVSAK